MGRIVRKQNCVFSVQRRFRAAIAKSDQSKRTGCRKLVLSYEKEHTAMTDRTGLIAAYCTVRFGFILSSMKREYFCIAVPSKRIMEENMNVLVFCARVGTLSIRVNYIFAFLNVSTAVERLTCAEYNIRWKLPWIAKLESAQFTINRTFFKKKRQFPFLIYFSYFKCF